MMLRIILWFIAFLLPALSGAVALAHGPYILIPALVAVDGLTGRHVGERRVMWLGLIFMYEVFYQLPIGMLTVPLIILMAVHTIAARMVSMEPVLIVGRLQSGQFLRSIGKAVVWLFGMVVISTWWLGVRGVSVFSWKVLSITWLTKPSGAWAISLIAAALIVLYADRLKQQRVMFK